MNCIFVCIVIKLAIRRRYKTPEMNMFVTIADGFQLLNMVTKSSV